MPSTAHAGSHRAKIAKIVAKHTVTIFALLIFLPFQKIVNTFSVPATHAEPSTTFFTEGKLSKKTCAFPPPTPSHGSFDINYILSQLTGYVNEKTPNFSTAEFAEAAKLVSKHITS